MDTNNCTQQEKSAYREREDPVSESNKIRFNSNGKSRHIVYIYCLHYKIFSHHNLSETHHPWYGNETKSPSIQTICRILFYALQLGLGRNREPG